jgi:hypothetical protein
MHLFDEKGLTPPPLGNRILNSIFRERFIFVKKQIFLLKSIIFGIANKWTNNVLTTYILRKVTGIISERAFSTYNAH